MPVLALKTVTHLECSLCKKNYPAGKIQNLCDCGGPLLVRYDLDTLRETWRRDDVRNGPNSMWRYAPGAARLASRIHYLTGRGHDAAAARRTDRRAHRRQRPLDQGRRSQPHRRPLKPAVLSCAVSMCVELGIRKIAIPSAGNAASAARRLRRGRRHRSPHLHAARRPAGELHRVQSVRRARHAGRRPDQRLRQDRRQPQRRRRLVRRQHAQGALPHRRQEDHGLRAGRADAAGSCRTPSSIPPAAASA